MEATMIERTDDLNVIEHRLLELVYTTDAPITATALAYFAPCSMENAEKVLDNLVARDRIQLEVGDDGTITYTFPNRHKLTPRLERAVEPPPRASLISRGVYPLATRGGRPASPAVAAVLSMLVPGAGQMYTGNLLSGLLWFMLVAAGYTLILPGLFLHLICVATAAGSAHRLNSSLSRFQLEGGY
jgi:TM2 domain-containing membrane protein YozV